MLEGPAGVGQEVTSWARGPFLPERCCLPGSRGLLGSGWAGAAVAGPGYCPAVPAGLVGISSKAVSGGAPEGKAPGKSGGGAAPHRATVPWDDKAKADSRDQRGCGRAQPWDGAGGLRGPLLAPCRGGIAAPGLPVPP